MRLIELISFSFLICKITLNTNGTKKLQEKKKKNQVPLVAGWYIPKSKYQQIKEKKNNYIIQDFVGNGKIIDT